MRRINKADDMIPMVVGFVFMDGLWGRSVLDGSVGQHLVHFSYVL